MEFVHELPNVCELEETVLPNKQIASKFILDKPSIDAE